MGHGTRDGENDDCKDTGGLGSKAWMAGSLAASILVWTDGVT